MTSELMILLIDNEFKYKRLIIIKYMDQAFNHFNSGKYKEALK